MNYKTGKKGLKISVVTMIYFLSSIVFALYTTVAAEVDKPVLFFPFDEGKGEIASDSSGNGNDGILHGALWVEGKKGSGIYFDGKGGYVNCGNSTSLNITDAVTLELWIKIPEEIVAGYVITKYHAITYSLHLIETGQIRCVLNTSDGESPQLLSKPLLPNEWYHLVATFDSNIDSNQMKMYINGRLDSQQTHRGKIKVNSENLVLGAATSAGGGGFCGSIDEVRLYNRALNPEEIKSHYRETHEPSEITKGRETTISKDMGEGKKTLAIVEDRIIIDDFEGEEKTKSNWNYPSFCTFTLSGEEVYSGKFSGKFSAPARREEIGASIGYKNETILPGEPKEISLWVHGDGKIYRFFLYLKDKTGETFEYRKGVDWRGWKVLKINLIEPMYSIYGNEDGIMDYPVSLTSVGIMIRHTSDVLLYLDDFTASESQNKSKEIMTEKGPGTHTVVSVPPEKKPWFQYTHEQFGISIERDKEVIDKLRATGFFDCPEITPVLIPGRAKFNIDIQKVMEEMPGEALSGGQVMSIDRFWGKNPSSPDSYFRDLCRLLKKENLYFMLIVGGCSEDSSMDPDSVVSRYYKECVKVATEEAPEHFVGYHWGEYDAFVFEMAFKGTLTPMGRERRALNTINLLRRVTQEFDPRYPFVTNYGNAPTNPGLAHDAGMRLVVPEIPHALANIEFVISNARGAARSFGEGHGWGTDPELSNPTMTGVAQGRDMYPTRQPMQDWMEWSGNSNFMPDEWEPCSYNHAFPVYEGYKMHILSYYSGAQWMRSLGGVLKPSANVDEITLYTPGTEAIQFFSYIQNHPRIGDVYAHLALVRSHFDNMFMWGFSRWKNVQILPEFKRQRKEFVGDAERDWIYLNMWFPRLASDLELSYTTRYWTGTPYGAMDIIYDRVPDFGKAISRYRAVFLLGYQNISPMYDGLREFVEKGGILFAEAPHIINLEQSQQSDLFGVNISDRIEEEIRGDIVFTSPSVFGFPEGKKYGLYSGEETGKVYPIKVLNSELMAKSETGQPILVIKRYGKGYTILASNYLYYLRHYGKASPSYNAFDEFAYTILDRMSSYPNLPIDISPKRDYVELLGSRDDKTGEVQLFLMNHGPWGWEGEIIVDKEIYGIDKHSRVVEPVDGGYKEIGEERISNSAKFLTIKASLQENGERAAKFTLIKISPSLQE